MNVGPAGRSSVVALAVLLPFLLAGCITVSDVATEDGDPAASDVPSAAASAPSSSGVVTPAPAASPTPAPHADALVIGFFQILAIFPGASRSGSSIAGGILRGFDRPSAARMAFLMSVPILTAAGIYETYRVIELPDTTEFLPYLVIGFVTAGVVGWLALKWLMGFLRDHSIYSFAVYCAVVGLICLAVSLF